MNLHKLCILLTSHKQPFPGHASAGTSAFQLATLLAQICTPIHACSNSSPSRNVINVDRMGRSITASTVQLDKSQRLVWLASKGHSLHGWDPLGQVPSLGIRCTWMTRLSSMHHQAGTSGSSPAFWCPTHVCLWQPQLGIQSVHTQSRLCCRSPHQRP